MIRKRNGFLLFCLSLMPGAGEMYMGFMKMGVSLMCGFFLSMIMIDMGMFDFMISVTVIVWFYSFFHVHNLAGMSDETFYEVKDTYLIPLAGWESENIANTGKYHKAAAVVLIIIGSGSLLKSLYYMVEDYLPEALRTVMREFGFFYLPRITFSVAIIALGIYMIKGKKKQLEIEDAQSQ